MHKIVKYECDICHCEFETVVEAVNCEQHHRIPKTVRLRNHSKQIVDDYHGYPLYVVVGMSDNTDGYYKLDWEYTKRMLPTHKEDDDERKDDA